VCARSTRPTHTQNTNNENHDGRRFKFRRPRHKTGDMGKNAVWDSAYLRMSDEEIESEYMKAVD
jgi:hypothetical protein